jgi:hypothetical protein
MAVKILLTEEILGSFSGTLRKNFGEYIDKIARNLVFYDSIW